MLCGASDFVVLSTSIATLIEFRSLTVSLILLLFNLTRLPSICVSAATAADVTSLLMDVDETGGDVTVLLVTGATGGCAGVDSAGVLTLLFAASLGNTVTEAASLKPLSLVDAASRLSLLGTAAVVVIVVCDNCFGAFVVPTLFGTVESFGIAAGLDRLAEGIDRVAVGKADWRTGAGTTLFTLLLRTACLTGEDVEVTVSAARIDL